MISPGEEGTISRLWPTVKISSSKLPNDTKHTAFVGSPKRGKDPQFATTANQNELQVGYDPTSRLTPSQLNNKIPSHQVVLEKNIHNVMPNMLRLNSDSDVLELHQPVLNSLANKDGI